MIKFLIRSNKLTLKFGNLLAYSGMPSGHTAITVSLVTILALEESIASPLFAVSVVLAILVIRDAVGLRRYLGQHGKTLNILVRDLNEDQMLDEDYPQLLERIGHTPAQVFVGAVIGFLTSLFGHYLFM